MRKVKFLRYALMIVTIIIVAFVASATAGAVTGAGPVISNVIPADAGTVYTNGTTTITAISADYVPGTSGSAVDPTSVMVHLDGGNMLFDCPTQTATHVSCNATVTDLFPGAHSLDIYVSDLAGNTTVNSSTLTVVVDNQPPTYSNLSPVSGSTILTSTLPNLLMEVDYSDPAPSSGGLMPMIHVNDSHDGTSGAMIMGCTKTATHYSCPAVKAKRLHLGSNWMEVLISDKVGNNNYSLPSRMNYYTVVDDVNPEISSISANSTTITASYSDPEPAGRLAGSATLASGINSATAMVHVDGTMIMMGCTANAASISCPTPMGLTPGPHTIEVMVNDNAGNPGMRSIILNAGRPALSLSAPAPRWGSYADYTAGILSVDWTLHNTGTAIAKSTTLTCVGNDNGIIMNGPATASLGDIAAAGSASTTLKYSGFVSGGYTVVGSWHTVNTGTAQDEWGTSYNYPV